MELVLADQAAHVLAVRPRFAAETHRVGRVPERQLAAVEDLVAVQVRDRHFGRRHEVQVPVSGDLEEVGLELRQVAGAQQGGGVHQVRRIDLGVAVFARMQVEHEVDERAHHARAFAQRDGETRAGHARRAFEVENAQFDREVVVRPCGVKSKTRGVPQRRTSTLSSADAPTGTDSCGRFGMVSRMLRRFASRSSSCGFELLDLLAAGLVGREDVRHVFAGLLGSRHRVAGAVLVAFQVLDLGNQLPPFGVQGGQTVEFGLHLRAALRQFLADDIQVVSHKGRIEHGRKWYVQTPGCGYKLRGSGLGARARTQASA